MKTVVIKNYHELYFEIEGLASTAHRDSYSEIIVQQGIDLSYLKTQGVPLDFEHGEKIGKITDAKITPEGLWIKGKIFYKSPYAKMIYKALEAQLPFENFIKFSVEIEDPIYSQSDTSIIIGGKLHAIAIIGFYKEAANRHTFAELLKSLNSPWLELELLQKSAQDPIFKLELLLSFLKHS